MMPSVVPAATLPLGLRPPNLAAQAADHPPLDQHFLRYFEVLPGHDAATRREIFRLRYEVYCEERGYEDRHAFPGGEEHDAYDADSVFALVRHRASGRAAGCVRLITNARTPGLRFPFEQLCHGHLDAQALDLQQFDRERCGEISRLAVHADFRRRGADVDSGFGELDPESYFGGDRRYPLVAMGLFVAATALALNAGLEQVVVVMEPRLARLLASGGLPFRQVGDIIHYRGRRAPFRIRRADLAGGLHPQCRRLLERLLPGLA